MAKSFFKNALRSAALLALLLAGCGGEQSASPAAQPAPAGGAAPFLGFTDANDTDVTSIRLSTSSEYDPGADEVRVFAVVKDQVGNSLLSFNAYNFVLTLNSRTAPQTVSPESITLSIEASDDRVVALVIDNSGSMAATASDTGETRLDVAKQAAKLFVSLMGPNDRVAVVAFSSSARTVQPLTGDQNLLTAAIDSLELDGATNIGAAMLQGVAAVGARPGKRAMVLLTDGDDTVDAVSGGVGSWFGNPQSTRNQGLEKAIRDDFSVFTVGLGTDLSESGLQDLDTIASLTGGQLFEAPRAQDLLTAFQQTVPTAIDALPPIETYVIAAPSHVGIIPGVTQELPFRLSAFYFNGNAITRPLTAESSGSYRVP